MKHLIESLDEITEARVVKVRKPIELVPKNSAAAIRMVETSLGNLLKSAKNPRKATREIAAGISDGSLPYIDLEVLGGRVLSMEKDEHDIAHPSGDPQRDSFASFDVPGKFEVVVAGFMPAAKIDSWMRKYIPGFKFSGLSGSDQQSIAQVIAASEVGGAKGSVEGLEDVLMEFISDKTEHPVDWESTSYGDSWDVSDISYLAKNGVRVRMKVTVNDPSIVVDLGAIEPHFDPPDRDSRHEDDSTEPGDLTEKRGTFKSEFEKAGKLSSIDSTIAKRLVVSGKKDGGKVDDDKIQVSPSTWPAVSLKPSQTSMVLDKALGLAVFMLKSGKVGGDLGAIVSSDKQIMDGHHRWAATILASGKKGKVGGYAAQKNGKDLLKVLNLLTKGKFKVQKGNKGTGKLSGFTKANVEKVLNGFVKNGIPGKFPVSAEGVRETLAGTFGSVERGIEKMGDNARLIEKSVPSYAPSRADMPVIDPDMGNVKKAVKALNKGEVDWNAPYKESIEIEEMLQLIAER